VLVVLCPIHALAVEPEEQPVPEGPIACFLIEHASILTLRADEAPYGRANVGHQIGPGTKTVLSIRAWEGSTSTDTAQLWKVTLEFAPIDASMPVGATIRVPVLRSYFTYGGLVWLTGEGYVWSENTIRYIGLIRTQKGLEAVLKESIAAKAAVDGRLTRTTVTWRCNIVRRKVAELDAWEGKPGTTYKSFHPAKTIWPVEEIFQK
jgi:hypothetical protein